jgi:hypothetical protein
MHAHGLALFTAVRGAARRLALRGVSTRVPRAGGDDPGRRRRPASSTDPGFSLAGVASSDDDDKPASAPPAAVRVAAPPPQPAWRPTALDGPGPRVAAVVSGAGDIVPLQPAAAAAMASAVAAAGAAPGSQRESAPLSAVKAAAYELRRLRTTTGDDPAEMEDIVHALAHARGEELAAAMSGGGPVTSVADVAAITREGIDHPLDSDPLRGG